MNRIDGTANFSIFISSPENPFNWIRTVPSILFVCIHVSCSELIGPPIRKMLPWQICYLVNFIVILKLTAKLSGKKNCNKNIELTNPGWILFDCVLFSIWTFSGKIYSEQPRSTNSRLILARLLRNWWISIKYWMIYCYFSKWVSFELICRLRR